METWWFVWRSAGPHNSCKINAFSWFLFLKSLHGKGSLKTYHPLRSRLWSPMDFCTMRRLWAIWVMNWGNLSEEHLKFNFMVFGASCFFGESQVSYFNLKFQSFSSELSFSHTNGLVKRGVCPHQFLAVALWSNNLSLQGVQVCILSKSNC